MGVAERRDAKRVEWDYNFERYIHIDGIELGYKGQVLFERHAVGRSMALLDGKMLGEDVEDNVRTETVRTPGRRLWWTRECKDAVSAVVTYDNAYDNVHNLAKFS